MLNGPRTNEARHLFNPMMCGVLLREAVNAHVRLCGKGMPFPETFLVLPIVFHKALREELTGYISTKMKVWLAEHDYYLLDFPRRAKAFVPYTRSGLAMACHLGILAFEQSDLILGDTRLRRQRGSVFPVANDEVLALKRTAKYVGRWFAHTGGPEAILSSWRIRP